jgi:hypothetical protein
MLTFEEGEVRAYRGSERLAAIAIPPSPRLDMRGCEPR